MRAVPLLVALALAGCGRSDGDAARAPEPSPTPTVVNATEREETAVGAACTELVRAIAETRPLPRSGSKLAEALRREAAAVRRYRRALQTIDPEAAPSWHVNGQVNTARDIERAHRVHAEAARKGVPATEVPVALTDPRVLSDADEQGLGADCGE